MIIVNGWKLLTIITKRSILDVAAALDPPLMAIILAVHYAFNVAYASKAFGAMHFMQKYLLEVDDEIKSPSKVLTVFSKVVKVNTIQRNILMLT